MALIDLIDKYKSDNNELRLTIILETYGKKATKKNLQSLKLLILDDDMDSVKAFLGINKQELEPVVLEEFEPNDDDFVIEVKKILGDPKDQNSTGNRILNGQLVHWHMKSRFKPDVVLQKFSLLTGKTAPEIDYHPSFKSNPPIWECAIAGTYTINRNPLTRVN